MNRVRIKICGITRVNDALAAVKAGADALGFVFYADSPRAVDADLAQSVVQAIPPFVSKVGLFVNAEEAYIRSVLEQVQLDVLQFHGEETEDECCRYGLPYYKAVRVREDTDIKATEGLYPNAGALLLDTYIAGVAGGTGQSFDWRLVPEELAKPVVLAGGLNSSNVLTAIQQVQPFAVDVSAGVESARGVKDHEKLREFTRQVYRAWAGEV